MFSDYHSSIFVHVHISLYYFVHPCILNTKEGKNVIKIDGEQKRAKDRTLWDTIRIQHGVLETTYCQSDNSKLAYHFVVDMK